MYTNKTTLPFLVKKWKTKLTLLETVVHDSHLLWVKIWRCYRNVASVTCSDLQSYTSILSAAKDLIN